MKICEIERFDSEKELVERLMHEYARVSTSTFVTWKKITNNFSIHHTLSPEEISFLKKTRISLMAQRVTYITVLGDDSNAVAKLDIILDYIDKIK